MQLRNTFGSNDPKEALVTLHYLYQISRWFARNKLKIKKRDYPKYVAPKQKYIFFKNTKSTISHRTSNTLVFKKPTKWRKLKHAIKDLFNKN